MYCPVLVGGPYNKLHVKTCNGFIAEELRFPAEPLLDMQGKPSICAPEPTADGPVRYRYEGFKNFMGNPVFKFVGEAKS